MTVTVTDNNNDGEEQIPGFPSKVSAVCEIDV
jgi:hypothetical protein